MISEKNSNFDDRLMTLLKERQGLTCPILRVEFLKNEIKII